MMILVHSAPSTLEKYRHPNLGVLSSPRRFYADVGDWPWAADNDAYSNWNPDRFRAMLVAISGMEGCLFVTAPDVVGDARATTERFYEWLPTLRECGQPIGYVTQDGLDAPPWDEIDAVFVGGTDLWKMSDQNRRIIEEAKTRDLWVHMGRVNSHQRVRYAKSIGCDSFDGMSLSWFKDRWLQQFLDHAAAPIQENLYG